MSTIASPRRGATAVLAVAALALTTSTACARPQTGEAVAAAAPPPSSSSGRTASPSTSVEPAGKATKPLTEPGTTLKYGQEAVIEHDSSSKVYTVGVVPVKVEKGNFQELAAAGLKIEEKTSAGKVPYYLTYKLVNRMEGTLSSGMTTPSRFSVVDKTNKPGGRLIVIAIGGLKLDACPIKSVPSGWSSDQEHTTCDIHLLPEGAEPGSVVYRQAIGKSPITWTP
ncbi:hypothetical protein [Allokutzneria albata]|uniref:Uncharacterized protein n=1 Tax=Allokutzneria albata TaxID=211114 RepID=A0A1G9VF19_ALLAB|nr:hypothetical protein [Allokutzneria albata]SDM70700.1 hypothetical protein SAMN04489726_2999 [Allokutzneria albata]